MQKRVLLVDDESSLRRSLSLGLNQNGYDVEPCQNGISALHKLDTYSKNHVDLESVVLDIELPDIDGIKLGKLIKSKYPTVPLIYITGYASKLNADEIERLQADALLEKPFDVEQLTEEFKKIEEKKAKTEVELKENEDVKTKSSFILMKVDEKADFIKIYRKLYYMDNVLYCDATRGDIDIVMLIQENSLADCEKFVEEEIKTIDGITDVEYMPVGVPVLNDSIKDIISTAGITLSEDLPGSGKVRNSEQSVCSYVLVDVEREKLDDIYPVLRLYENVLYCDYTTGKYNLVLMVHGTHFSEIDKFVENKIIKLDGVLKVKEYPVINIFEM
jgi:CheY-like chemotaxis protein